MRTSIFSFVFAFLVTANPILSRQAETFESDGNPILSDGSIYSADPAPFTVGDTVYILTGRDEADTGVNSFIMNEWQIFEATKPDPAGGTWTLHRDVAQPQSVFAWAQTGGAYASQIVEGPDGRYYLFASAQEAGSSAQDAFSIGVGVSDSPTGPFEDAHPEGPIISQNVPEPNNIHNIDPSVLVDDDGRVFVYWGSFNQLRGVELDSDMTTIIGEIVSVEGLTGFFEAPWFMKREETYYMLFAANNAGPDSPCTPTSYHACIAYGTASEPLGPWTFQSVILDIVSSTTSHPGVYSIGNEYLSTTPLMPRRVVTSVVASHSTRWNSMVRRSSPLSRHSARNSPSRDPQVAMSRRRRARPAKTARQFSTGLLR